MGSSVVDASAETVETFGGNRLLPFRDELPLDIVVEPVAARANGPATKEDCGYLVSLA